MRTRRRSSAGFIAALATATTLAALRAVEAPATRGAIDVPLDAPACVRWGADELARTFERRGYGARPNGPSVRVVSSAAAGDAPESYRILRAEDGTLLLSGTDPVGTMYGLLDLAEQFAAAPPGTDAPTARAAIAPAQARPFVRWRGLNLFLHLTPEGQVAPWFHDEELWRRLFDLLACSRFNWIDLHGAYCPQTTVFSNLLPHFTSLGQPDAAAARNLAMLKRVVEMADARGIRVALLNYDDRDPAGKDREERIEATGKRIGELARGCPNLHMLGTRVKRSGGGTVDRFGESYVKSARAAGFTGPFYTRSWGTDRWTVEHLAKESGKRFFVEVKYNGEQLGTPYPAIQGWGEDYSYQDFLDPPRNFEVLWQVRANGTCRVLPWCDPSFVREAAQGFGLGGAAGFSIEPHWAYFLPDPALRYRDAKAALAEGEQYLFERDRAWYLVWGRLTYDPATTAAVLLRPWVNRHGPRAGDAASRTTLWMSRLLTTLYAAQAYGVDHRDAAVEMEIGLLTKNRDHSRSLTELCAIAPLDRARGCSPAEFAEAAAAGKGEPRRTPIDFAADLERLAAETNAAADELTAMLPEAANAGAARALSLEARAAVNLGQSGAARLRALTAYAFYEQTKDTRWLPKAREELERAAARWSELAAVADQLYLPIQDPLRAGRDFTWASVQAHHQRLLAEVDRAIQRASREKAMLPGTPRLADVYARARAVFGAPRVSSSRAGGEELLVQVRFPEGQAAPRRLYVLFKPLDSGLRWSVTDANDRGGSFSVKLKEPKGGLLIQFQALDEEGRGWLWPDGMDRPLFLRH